MRLLLFADLHLDAPFAWARPEAASRRRQNLRDTLKNVLAVADEVRADAILCAGDLYEHDRLSPDTRQFVQRALADAGRPVLLAPGNHDWYGPRSLYTQARWPAHVHVFSGDRPTAHDLADGLTIWGAAFHGPVRAEGFLANGFAVDRSGVNLALFHGSERSAPPFETDGKARHAPFDAGEIERAGLRHAFVGHYHRPKDDPLLTYPGNPDPLTFGEEGERGVVIVDVGGRGELRSERRRVAVSEVHDLDLDVTACGSAQHVRDRVEERLRGLAGCVRLTLCGELAPEIELGRETLSGLSHGLDDLVVRTGDLHEAYAFEAIARERTVRGQFVRDVMAAEMLSEERRRCVLVTGLRALDGRDDLEVA